jgi:hypothetical protein
MSSVPPVLVKIKSSFCEPDPSVFVNPYNSAVPNCACADADKSVISITPASILSL